MENEKLLISILIDNSLSIGEERLNTFKLHFNSFYESIRREDFYNQIEIELISYNDFSPIVIKNFGNSFVDLSKLNYGKIPFYDRMLGKALDDINEKTIELSYVGKKYYKPWVISLVDSKTFDKEMKSLNMLSSLISNKKITFFPFKLKHDISFVFKEVEKIRPFIEIQNYDFAGFFKWLKEMAMQRISLPAEQNVQLQKDSFKGWTTL